MKNIVSMGEIVFNDKNTEIANSDEFLTKRQDFKLNFVFVKFHLSYTNTIFSRQY
jgi:hypothetical protein